MAGFSTKRMQGLHKIVGSLDIKQTRLQGNEDLVGQSVDRF